MNKKEKKKSIFRYLGMNMKGYSKWIFAAAFFAAFEVVLEMFIPLLMSVLVDGGLYHEENFMLHEWFSPELVANNTKFIITVGTIMVIVALVSMAAGLLSARYSAHASQGFAKNLRTNILNKIQSFSFKNTDHFSTASLITRGTTDVNQVRNMVQQVIRSLFRQPIMLVLTTVMSFIIAPDLAWLFLIAIPILAIILVIIMRIGIPRFRILMRRTDEMNRAVQENLTNSRVVKAYVRGDYETEQFEENTDRLRKAQLRSARLFELSGPAQMLIMWGCSVLIFKIGGENIIYERTGLLVGELTSIISYTTMAINSLAMMTWLLMALTRSQASLERINEIMDEEPDIADGPEDIPPVDGSVEFKDVCFSYAEKENALAINHISFKIESGETIGIIGGTGEGKSTLVNLIPRFYDTLSGEVLVGGKNVKDYTLNALRSEVSMVLQNGTLFSGTIASNLRWGKNDATLEEMKEACHIACADEYIDHYPEKYDKVVEQNAANLSGGQKQRLRIARAVIKKPKVLILDDSTSAVDMTTDEHIRKALRNSLPNTTKIIIAQRIASIVTCDRILVIEEGKLSDFGTHEELMKRSTIYKDVYDSQMKGEEMRHA